MKNFNFVLPVVVVVAFVLILTLLPVLFLSSVEMKDVENVTVELSENFMFREEKWYYPLKGMVVKMGNDTIPIGVAGQKYELNFGKIPQNSSTKKILNFGTKNSAKAELYTSGNISPYVIVLEEFYVDEKKEITVTFNGTEIGNFTGTLLIRNLIPKNFFAEKIMRLI